jgi:hypothetical protein
VTERDDAQVEDSDPPISPPQTGNDAVDDALVGLADLASAPLAEHHDRLAKAHKDLQEALDREDDGPADGATPG